MSVNATFREPAEFPTWFIHGGNFLKVYSSLILFGGVLGNALSLPAFWRNKSCRKSTRIIFASMAVTDTMALLSAVTRYWINSMFQYDIRTSSDLACQAQIFFIYFSFNSSIALLMALGIERFCLVLFPVKTTCLKRTRNTAFSILVIFVVFAVKEGIGSSRYKVYKITETLSICRPPMNEAKQLAGLQLFYHAFISYTTLFVTNVGVFWRVKKSFTRISTDQASKRQNQSIEKRSLTATKMIIAITVYHLLTNIPGQCPCTLTLFHHPIRVPSPH